MTPRHREVDGRAPCYDALTVAAWAPGRPGPG